MRLSPRSTPAGRLLLGGTGLLLAAVASSAPLAPGVPAAPARAAEGLPCSQVALDTPRVDTTATSRPLQQMHVRDAQELVASRPRDPRTRDAVAVLDSGVVTGSPLLDVERETYGPTSPLQDWHGTAVAGLVAGHERPDGKPLGVAPTARIVDVRVYEGSDPSTGGGVTTADVAAGLDWVAANADRLGIGVANISLAVGPDEALAAAVRKAWAADVVVVAATGNRPQADGDFGYEQFAGEPEPGEDAGAVVFPAGYDDVVGVNATAPGQDVLGSVLQSSATDVAAPAAGLVTLGLNGGTCLVEDLATSWAAAEVSGVVALLRQRYPDEHAPQVVARLLETANGTPEVPTPLEGAGVVQPVEAVTRPLRPQRDGDLRSGDSRAAPAGPAAVAPPRDDVLAATRDHALWWGLLGGGALLVALVLRPLLARRR